jgi:hypothetical protein
VPVLRLLEKILQKNVAYAGFFCKGIYDIRPIIIRGVPLQRQYCSTNGAQAAPFLNHI